MEDYAWVIEYLPLGHASALKKEAIVQLVGANFFTLLEASIKPNASIVLGKKVFVGKEGREEIEHIKGRIKYDDLTRGAKDFLSSILKKAVADKEAYFINFINKARPISIRVHTIDLLPGIGKKNMEAILTEREKQAFESFEDIKKRIPSISDPVSIFVNRVKSELAGNEKYYLFVKPPTERRRPPGRFRR